MPDVDQIRRYEAGEMEPEEEIAFFQDGINKGWIWRLQGSYGRAAARLISAGLVVVP